MYYLETNSRDPYFNLAFEEYVFEKLDSTKQYFMLWQNDNSIVVGKYQNTVEEINQQYVDAHKIRVARRLSGGGAVYHDSGNLNFTFIVDKASNEDFNFSVFVVPVIKTLEDMGVHAELTGRNDLTIDEKKFSGNSQYCKKNRIMHHGCIMLDSNLTTVSEALRVKEVKFESKSVKSVQSRVTTINANTENPVVMEQFKQMLKGHIFQADGLEPLTLSEEQISEIYKLRDEKYAKWEWNYGASPAYDMRKEKKFPSGLVTVMMKAENGCIRSIRFYGDFFGNGNISELQDALVGLQLNVGLREKLEEIDINTYIRGLSANDLFGLLYY